MHRFLIATLAVLLAGISGGALAADRGPNPEAKERGEHRDRRPRVERRHRDPAGIPPLFRELCPFRAARLADKSRENPGRARRVTAKLQRLVRELEQLRTTDVQEYERRRNMLRTEDNVSRLAHDMRTERSDRARSEKEKKLKEELSRLFDQKEESQRLRIKHLENEIAALRARLDRRSSNRERIILRRLEELKGDDDLRF